MKTLYRMQISLRSGAQIELKVWRFAHRVSDLSRVSSLTVDCADANDLPFIDASQIDAIVVTEIGKQQPPLRQRI